MRINCPQIAMHVHVMGLALINNVYTISLLVMYKTTLLDININTKKITSAI